MKKLLCIILMGTLVFTACASTPQDGGTSQENKQDEETNDKVEKENQAYENMLLESTNLMPQLEELNTGDVIAVMTTSMGEIKIKFCPEEAPKAVENFISLAKKGYYDGITFHRVIDEFMIQGGDPNGNGTGGESVWGGKFDDEFSPKMYHFRGALAMANSGANTNGSQFYIVQNKQVEEQYFENVDSVIDEYGGDKLLTIAATGKIFRTNYNEDVRKKYLELGGTPQLDYGYTIFGQVYEGMDVVDKIAAVEKDESDKPLKDVVIEKLEIKTVE